VDAALRTSSSARPTNFTLKTYFISGLRSRTKLLSHSLFRDRFAVGRWLALVAALNGRSATSAAVDGIMARISLLEKVRGVQCKEVKCDAAISVKSRLFETLQHVVVGGLRAELRSEPLGV
jgi:hypothetical protein